MQKSITSRIPSLSILMVFFLLVFTIIGIRTFRTHKPSEQSKIVTQSETITAGSNQYKKYSIHIPAGWTYSRNTSKDKLDSIVISKNNYKIEIYQKTDPEYLSCNVIFAQDTNVLGTNTKASFIDFTGNQGKLYRRSILPPNPNAQKTSNTICEETPEGYTLPTQFGVIEYETPIDADTAVIKEMDSMIQSLQ